METLAIYSLTAAVVLWGSILLLPWRPWARQPFLDAPRPFEREGLTDVTVLIPARNEGAFIQRALQSLALQGHGLTIIVVDDQSTDDTVQVIRRLGLENLVVLAGKPLPVGWSGKLWALEQGRRYIRTRLTLLMDADIELQPGIVAALRAKMREQDLHLISLMAVPHMVGFWERLLMPAFVYFFKLLYPFRLANSRYSKVAAAAGGCILLETRLLEAIGGFAALQNALIDDCALAYRVKSHAYRTWIGLTHAVRSLRSSGRLGEIWNAVARTAFTQLKYSSWLLGVCTLLMVLGFWIPVAGLFYPDWVMKSLAVAALLIMMITYLPILKFYDSSPLWALAMPLIGTLYLAMTWSSAIRYWRGERARWKGRTYNKSADTGTSNA